MEQRTDSPYPKKDRPVLAIIGVLLVVSTVLFAWSDRKHDWRYYQYAFRAQVTEKLGAEKAATIPKGVQQIWVSEMRRADRCITCHQAMLWKGFEKAENPYKSHPVEPLKGHPIEKYGCTACHGGQGWAIDAAAAHGPVEHWEEPLLGSQLGEAYTLSANKAALMQMNCNVCHRFDRETKGADEINLAKKLVLDKGCRACHVINGRGGTIGPDLTWVGDKAPEQYEYGRLSGQKTAYAWHVAHLKDPRALVPETVMPNFHFTTREAQALAMLALSWRRAPIPADYRPGLPRTDPQTPEEIAEEAAHEDRPWRLVRQDGLFRLPLDPVARGQEPRPDRPGPLDGGRGHAVALRPHGRRLPARTDGDHGRRALAADRAHAGAEGGRGREAPGGVRRTPETEGRGKARGRRPLKR